MLVRAYTCPNVKLLEISCRGSNSISTVHLDNNVSIFVKMPSFM